MNALYEIDETMFFEAKPESHRKLSEKDVETLREGWFTQKEAAKLFQVSQSTISRSLRRAK